MPKSKKDEPPKGGAGRTRNYATVVYPESAPENWRDTLTDFMIPAFISPLHDKDIDPQKQPKKPHFHVILMFDSVKTKEQAKEIFDALGGVGCERVQSIRGYARYLCHLDNPEKAQYKPSEVTQLCGADYQSVISLATDRLKTLREIMAYCADNNIISFAVLLQIAMETNDEWFKVLCENGTLVVKEYLKSLAWDAARSGRS